MAQKLKRHDLLLPGDHPVFALPRRTRNKAIREWIDAGMRFSKIEDVLVEIDRHLLEVQERLTRVEEKVSGVEEKVSGIEEKIGDFLVSGVVPKKNSAVSEGRNTQEEKAERKGARFDVEGFLSQFD